MVIIGKERTSIIWTIPYDDLIRLVDGSESISDLITKLGLSVHGSHYRTFNLRVKSDQIDISQLVERGKRVASKNRKVTLDNVLTEGSTYSRGSIKRRLVEEGLLEYKCSECGMIDEYNGKQISLQLDHINGINNDNRIENLRFLCPNCHSQTETFVGKNNKKKIHIIKICTDCGKKIFRTSDKCKKCSNSSRKLQRPIKDILLKQIEDLGHSETGRLYGVSHTTIKRWSMR